VEGEGKFDVTDDYPRGSVIDYENAVAAGEQPARVVKVTYALEKDDIAAVEQVFGPKCLKNKKPTVAHVMRYSNKRYFEDLNIDEAASLKHLVEAAGLPSSLQTELLEKKTAKEMADHLASAENTEASQRLKEILALIVKESVAWYVFNKVLHPRIPRFLYFDEYYRMRGQENLEALKQRFDEGKLKDYDHPLLGLVELAGLDLDTLLTQKRTEALLAKLDAAESKLTTEALQYWSQNKHIQLKFEIQGARPQDPAGMREGTNLWGRVRDTRHGVSTPIGRRSRGFVWFFSFLAWYSQLRKKGENLILLLDEPGLSLHAKAQADLLRYFEERLKPVHQVIYTTHSPFMVDPQHFDRVRIVQDLSIDTDKELPEEKQGTKVITEVLDATADSLFPLQGALGYEIYQTLFIGPNSLVVEGVSDLLYIETISALLQAKGEPGLSNDWTITPVGGADKVPTFVSLIGAQKKLRVAVLIDYQKRHKQAIENLYKRKLLKKKNVITFADFVTGEEADIEDMFEPEFYLKLVNAEFGSSITVGDLPSGTRIVARLEKYLVDNPLPTGTVFSHYRPARYFTENIGTLKSELTEPELGRFNQAFATINELL